MRWCPGVSRETRWSGGGGPGRSRFRGTENDGAEVYSGFRANRWLEANNAGLADVVAEIRQPNLGWHIDGAALVSGGCGGGIVLGPQVVLTSAVPIAPATAAGLSGPLRVLRNHTITTRPRYSMPIIMKSWW